MKFKRILSLFAAACLLLPPAAVSAAGAEDGYARIYESDTGLINAPTVLTPLEKEEDLALFTGETPPSVAVLTVDDSLNVVLSQKPFPLEETLSRLGDSCAAAVRIQNGVQADAFAAWCEDSKTKDLFALSSDPALLNKAASPRYTLGIYDVRGTSPTVEEASAAATEAHAKIILSDLPTFGYSENRRLKNLQIFSWTAAEGEEEIYEALYENHTGILTTSPAEAYAVYSYFPQRTVFDASFLIGHRGSSGTFPENSVEAVRHAIEQGVESVEYDVHLTKDKQVVVMHDDDISTTTNGTGKVAQMTLAEIKQYHLIGTNGATAEIPTLEDMFAALAQSDAVHYIEYKANSEELVPYVKELVDKYHMTGKVVFISFFANVLQKSQQLMPQIPTGQLYGNFDTRDIYDALDKTVSEFAALGKSNHCTYTYLYKQYIAVARHRGIASNGWTFTNNAYLRHFLYGMTSLTIDDPSLVPELPLRVEAEDFTAEAGKAFRPRARVLTAANEFEADCSLLFPEGTFTETDAGYLPAAAGQYRAVLLYCYDKTYSVASRPITVTVTAQEPSEPSTPAEPDPPTPEEPAPETPQEEAGGCGGMSGTVFLLPFLALLIKKKD